MRVILYVMVVWSALTMCGCSPEERVLPEYEYPFDETTHQAFNQEEQADLVVSYRTYNDTLRRIIKRTNEKELIVVIFTKHGWTNEAVMAKVAILTQHYFNAGYKRVVIQQGLGNGRGIWSDQISPEAEK